MGGVAVARDRFSWGRGLLHAAIPLLVLLAAGTLLSGCSATMGVRAPVEMLNHGERIRVTRSEPASPPVTGTLLELSESAMTLEEEKGTEVLTVPLDSVHAVERSLGPQPNTGRGMLYGFLSGAAVGDRGEASPPGTL